MRIVPNRGYGSLLQCLHWAGFCALVAQDALRGVFAFAGVLVNLYLHWANLQAFAAVNALAFVAADAKQGKVTHRLKEDRDGTDVLAESTVVFEYHGQGDAKRVINHISDEKEHEHGVLGALTVME